MALRSLVPWRRGEIDPAGDPFVALRREMDEMLDRFLGGPEIASWTGGRFAPTLDVTETEKEVRVTVDIPGMDDKEIELSLSDDCLVIKGEKKEEKEEKEGGRHYVERSHGSFQRQIALPCEVDAEKVKATCKKGVLTVTLPKTAKARNVKKISISSS